MAADEDSKFEVAGATVIAIVNAAWTTLVLGYAVVSESTCSDNAATESQCGGGIGLGFLWLVGQMVLFIPMGWAVHRLVYAASNEPGDVVWVGVGASIVVLAIPIAVVALLIVGG